MQSGAVLERRNLGLREGVVGRMEVVCGPMFSGKTGELLRRTKRARIAGKEVLVFKPAMDDRYDQDCVVSHDRVKTGAVNIQHSSEILMEDLADIHVVAVDEVQFLDEEIAEVCAFLADQGLRVICAGLDLNYRAEPFGPMPQLLAVADRVDKLAAVCMVCGHDASRSQLLVNGEPAPYDLPEVRLGGTEAYEARCRACFVAPEKPSSR